jgi:hypothetical protein
LPNPSVASGFASGVLSAAFEYNVASGEHGAVVVVAGSVQIATLTPAIGRPVGPNTTSSLREPCAAAVAAHRIAHESTTPIAFKIFTASIQTPTRNPPDSRSLVG